MDDRALAKMLLEIADDYDADNRVGTANSLIRMASRIAQMHDPFDASRFDGDASATEGYEFTEERAPIQTSPEEDDTVDAVYNACEIAALIYNHARARGREALLREVEPLASHPMKARGYMSSPDFDPRGGQDLMERVTMQCARLLNVARNFGERRSDHELLRLADELSSAVESARTQLSMA